MMIGNAMRNLLILAGAAAVLALPVSALAKDHGHGNQGHGQNHSRYEAGDRESDRYDRGDRDDIRADRDDDRGHDYRRGCPPGLAKKHNGCLPPGQAWRVGQRSPWHSDRYVSYRDLPSSYRDRYAYNSGQRYYYSGNRVYTIDPRTQLIRSIVNLLR